MTRHKKRQQRRAPARKGWSRRDFIKIGAAAGGGLYFSTKIGDVRYLVRAAIPGGTLDPSAVPKYQTPLLIPPIMPRAGTIIMPAGKMADYYEISVRQFIQQILPAGMPATTVWATVRSAPRAGTVSSCTMPRH